ncbi:hypothetical protein ACHAW6_009185 [Cyclotella cf. meneghiniana]
MNDNCTSPSVVDAAKSLSQCKRPPAQDHHVDIDHSNNSNHNDGVISLGNKRMRAAIEDVGARGAATQSESYASFPAPANYIVNDCHTTVHANSRHDVSQSGHYFNLHRWQTYPKTGSTMSRVVRLSITKVEPSYIEPWRKMSPVSIVGVGVILPLNFSHEPHGSDITINTHNDATGTQGTGGNKTGSLRILTNAANVNHATHIRALIPSLSYSPVSVSCRVEWISLSMDLALLTPQHADSFNCFGETISTQSSIHISDRLPMLGEQVTYIGASQTAPSSLEFNNFGRNWDNDHSNNFNTISIVRGTVSSFYSGEDHHFMLRMTVDVPTLTCAAGVIIDDFRGIVGIIGSTSKSIRTNTFIPGLVINQFLNQCISSNGPYASSSHDQHQGSNASDTGATWTTGDMESESRKKLVSQITRSDTAKQQSEIDNEAQPDRLDIYYPTSRKSSSSGIASLGITGYQTLENKALRQTFGVDIEDVVGVRITGVHHIAHSMSNTNYDYDPPHCNQGDSHCYSSTLKADDVLLAVDGEPVMLDGTVRLAPGRENERVDFRWLISKCKPGTQVQLDVIRQKKRMQINATLSAPRYLVSRLDEEGKEDLPSYVIAGGCVFVPLSHAWMAESRRRNPLMEFEGFQRYLLEQRKGMQQLLVLSHVLADEVNLGYHGMGNLLLTSVNGQRPANMRHLVDILVKSEIESTLEFRCTSIHSTRAKIVICMDSKQVLNSESTILGRHMIDSWCSENDLSSALKRESEVKTHRHGVTCGLKTMRALRNAISETTIVVQNPRSDADRVVATTKRILNLSEAHKMQSAPNFSGKYIEDVGWTQVKTKHLSQLCQCGKSTRFYCICSVGVMRCKDCFLKHCRDHMSNGPEDGCGVCGEKTELLAEGIDLVTTRKRKPNNPNQAVQSRCAVCRAKTCFCCSACGFEPEIPLCDVTTGRNCLAIHTTEHHSCKHEHHS